MACSESHEISINKANNVLWAVGVAMAIVLVIASISSHQAQASPKFAAQTKLPCTKCHAAPPNTAQNLTDFGKQFKDNGDQLPK